MRKPKQEKHAYDSRIALWSSRDPIGERGGLNLYGLVLNDPANLWDYLGREPSSSPTLDPSGRGSQWRVSSTGRFAPPPQLPPPPPGSNLVPNPKGSNARNPSGSSASAAADEMGLAANLFTMGSLQYFLDKSEQECARKTRPTAVTVVLYESIELPEFPSWEIVTLIFTAMLRSRKCHATRRRKSGLRMAKLNLITVAENM